MGQTWWTRLMNGPVSWIRGRPRRIWWFLKYGRWWKANRPTNEERSS